MIQRAHPQRALEITHRESRIAATGGHFLQYHHGGPGVMRRDRRRGTGAAIAYHHYVGFYLRPLPGCILRYPIDAARVGI